MKGGEYRMFIGQYQHSIDSKHRLFIPANFRKDKHKKYVVTCGLEKCLFMYTPDGWKTITEKFQNISFTKSDARQFLRLFFSGASEVYLDSQGRILIPMNLFDYARLKRNVVIIGVQERIEIWNKNLWFKYQNHVQEKYSEVAENLVF